MGGGIGFNAKVYLDRFSVAHRWQGAEWLFVVKAERKGRKEMTRRLVMSGEG
jgi:hypothetical protein